MPTDDVEIRQNERITSLEHAMFGVGDAGGGMVDEIRGLRNEFHEFRQDVNDLSGKIVVATFATVGTIIGGVIVLLLNLVGPM